MNTNYTGQDRGNKQSYQQYLEAMDAISVEKVASASTFFEPEDGNTIVDVGMASGTSTAILAQLFPNLNIIGVDINPRMVEIAQNSYTLPNLSFRVDDGEKLESFEEGSVNGFFNCSAIHHITSYNGYDNNRAFNTLKRQVELLKDRGILVVRDFVKPEEKEVILDLSIKDRINRPNDCDLLLQFAHTARSLAPFAERGFPIEELGSPDKNTRSFRLYYTDAVEFIRRKDYYGNWDIELQEEYGYFTQKEFEEYFQNLGLRIIVSSPIYNTWIINNRYKGQFKLYDVASGKEIGFPPTNYLIAGEKIKGGKQVLQVRHLPQSEQPYLKYSSYRNIETGKIYDVAERPHSVSDFIPYYKHGDRIIILAKHGYPRPLVNVKTDSPVIDGKYYSGYIPEGITVSNAENHEAILADRFGVAKDTYTAITHSLNYYTSPGGIKEKVSSNYIELKQIPAKSIILKGGFSGFKESGFIHQYDAIQLLNNAQTGTLIEARLELNIYHLLHKQGIELPKWLGEKIRVKHWNHLRPVTKVSELLSIRKSTFTESSEQAGFLKVEIGYFAETDITGSHSILEYVYPKEVSSNTLLTLPVYRKDGEIYIGLEVRDLPVPQLLSGNSTILTVPAKRLPKSVSNISQLNQYISEMRIGKRKIERYFKLGEKYFPSIGITTEQVYPYVVCLSRPTKELKWVALDDLMDNIDNIEDAHLLISLHRLKHALDSETDISMERLINLLKDEFYIPEPITENSLIEKDLGITGDDGDELLIAIEDEFGIRLQDEENSIRKTFNLKEDEYLFHGEGLDLFASFRKYKIIPLTVKMLYEAMLRASRKSIN